MADVSHRRMNEAPPPVREAYEKMLRGTNGGMLKLLACEPGLLGSFLSFFGTVGQSLPRRVYEMVYIRIAAVGQCHS